MRKRIAALGVVLACSAATGCSVLTGGRAVPADTDGPKPVPAAALREVLLRSTTINDIMGASGMTVKDSRARLFDVGRQFSDRSCMAAWTPAEQTVYAGSGWTALVAQTLLRSPGVSDDFVIQAVVGFSSREVADGFFDETARKWTPCGHRTFVTHQSSGSADIPWTFDVVSNADSTLWMTQTQDDDPGWSCQRALRVSNNVAIDVLACKPYVADEAVTIAQAIDARLPSV